MSDELSETLHAYAAHQMLLVLLKTHTVGIKTVLDTYGNYIDGPLLSALMDHDRSVGRLTDTITAS